MSTHLATDMLSAYLDQELAERQSGRVEEHLSECAGCQQRLDGLHRVVLELQGAGVPTVPSTVLSGLRHRLRAGHQPRGFLEGFEGRLRELAIPQTSMVMTFVLVMTLVGLVYVFVWGVDRHRSRSQPTDPVRASEALVGDREFVLNEGIWVEKQLIGRQVDRALIDGSADFTELLGAEPQLGNLLRTADVVVDWNGETVRLEAQGLAAPSTRQ